MGRMILNDLKTRYFALNRKYLYERLCKFESIEECFIWFQEVLQSDPGSKGNLLQDPDSLALSEAEMKVLAEEKGTTIKTNTEASKNIEEKFEKDLGWGNDISDTHKDLKAEEQLLEDYKFIEKLINNFSKRATKNGQEVTIPNNSIAEKPHKDVIYKKYGEFKSEKIGVDDAFDKICGWIEGEGFNVGDYIKTDTPQNFDKSYREWLKRKGKS